MSASVARYLGSTPGAALVGGADGGSAGFPLGKKPFIKEGPNKVNFVFNFFDELRRKLPTGK